MLPLRRARLPARLPAPTPAVAPHRRCRAFATSIVTTDITDGVATVTLNAPEKMNAMTVAMGEGFETAISELRREPPSALRCVVLTGSGRAFSAGGDLEWLMERHHDEPSNNALIMRDFYARFLSVRSLPVPVIAAVNGPAIGAGMALACACDIRIAAPDAKLGITFVGLGLPPGMGSTHWLPTVVGPQRAAELLLTGEVIDVSTTTALSYPPRRSPCGVAPPAPPQPLLLASPRADGRCG